MGKSFAVKNIFKVEKICGVKRFWLEKNVWGKKLGGWGLVEKNLEKKCGVKKFWVQNFSMYCGSFTLNFMQFSWLEVELGGLSP